MLVSIHAHTQGATNLEFACTYPARRFNPRTHTGCDPIALYARLAVVKFQSTHPHGVRRKGNCYLLDNGKVSIHAPTRGATIAGRMLIRRIGFQSTHPHGVRRFALFCIVVTPCFNPRTHTGCDMTKQNLFVPKVKFQSTHPHGVRRNSDVPKGTLIYVSIHAPTRGATVVVPSQLPYVVVSIHAPTRGATASRKTCTTNGVVSIHAPTRGATYNPNEHPSECTFQSTHPHGVRPDIQTWIITKQRFQSTHPHGVRLPVAWMVGWRACFNPRTHTGCDALVCRYTLHSLVSIHAPTRGATLPNMWGIRRK